MKLLGIEENAVIVELDWSDTRLLSHLCRYALERAALADAPNWPAPAGHATALVAFLEAAGLASYAPFVATIAEPEKYSLDGFRELYPLRGQHAAWAERQSGRWSAAREGGDSCAS